MSQSRRGRTPVVVVGQIARDLVLQVDSVPSAGGSSSVSVRHELLGGKGANQAVAAAQLGAAPRLVGVVGDDDVGASVVRQAAVDGIDVQYVVTRTAPTALLVDLVDAAAHNRFLEHVPDAMLLHVHDVQRAALAFDGATAALVQLQQPASACVAAAELAQRAGCLVVLDGAITTDSARETLMATATVLRADAREAGLMLGRSIESDEQAVSAAQQLKREGADIVVVSAGASANVVASDDGILIADTLPVDVADPTGGGDSFVAAFALALARGAGCEQALREATAASAFTVGRLGGRPDLSLLQVRELAAQVRVTAPRFRRC